MNKPDPEEAPKEMPRNVHGAYSISLETKHLESLLDLIATDNEIDKSDLVDFDLCFYDTTPGELVGIHEEFISCARQDNMIGSMTATYALIDHSRRAPVNTTIDMIDEGISCGH